MLPPDVLDAEPSRSFYQLVKQSRTTDTQATCQSQLSEGGDLSAATERKHV